MTLAASFSRPLVFVDLETTGGSPARSRVLEVGLIRVEAGRPVAKLQTLVDPEEPIPGFITNITGIRPTEVIGAPRFADFAPQLADLLDGAVFVAHNVHFDYHFLRMEYERLGQVFRPPLLCTVRLSRALYPEVRGHKLQNLIDRHGLQAAQRHRAYDDAHVLWQFWQLVWQGFAPEIVQAAVERQLAPQRTNLSAGNEPFLAADAWFHPAAARYSE